ncbi:hypothetical protein ACN4EG_19055 [Alkalinema pantanalense CENA528]|uniref:hypothetical protein n=1 Tax=Alkalinema pantanalense TaxID=1620705 RepID=UPI003D6DE7B2
MMLNVLLIGILIGIVIGISWVQLSASPANTQRHSQPRSSRPPSNLRVLLGKSRFQALSDRPPASPELQQKLISLFNGDREAAEQWVAKARFGRPGKSEAYYWFRAIQLFEQKN